MTGSWAGRAAYLKRRRAERRQTLLALLGGCCVRCGGLEDLQFDHIAPGSRSFLLSGDGFGRRWDLVLAEAEKCQILCDPCHRKKSKECGETGGGRNKNSDPLEHGSARCYQEMPCRCLPCRTAKNLYRSKQFKYSEVMPSR
jgi:hypothetical protein